MSAHVLVVDDDLPLAQSLGDMLASMDHTYELAGDVETARKKLESGKFNLLLLDMNLPMSPGRLGRRENGRNFIEIIRGKMGLKDLPIIVVTGEDGGEADFILSVVKSGGMNRTQYIQKPIEGDKIDQAVRQALAGPAPDAVPSAPTPAPAQQGAVKILEVKPFSSAVRQLHVYSDEVRLCGITIWSDRGQSDMRDVLLLLKEKPDGRYVRLTGPSLMKKFDRDRSNPIARPIKNLCDRAKELMLEHRGLECGRYDLIDSRGGYHLTDWIDVQVIDGSGLDADLRLAEQASVSGPRQGKSVPQSSSVKLEAELKDLPAKQIERLLAICQTLKDGGARGFEDIQRITHVSRSQNMRDIAVLVDRGLLEKDGQQKERVYRLTQRVYGILKPGS